MAFAVFIDMFPVILETLEEYSSKPNTRKEGVASAASLLRTVSAFDFLVTLIIVNKCLSYLSNLSRSLQERSIDIAKALAQVNVLKDCMKNNRQNVDNFHTTCYKEAAGIAEKSGIDITKPRTCGRQTKRNNTPADGPEEYYKRSVTIPFLDHLLNELDTRFSCLHERAAVGMSLVPSVMLSRPSTEELSFFSDDLPHHDALHAELNQWYVLWEGASEKTDNLTDAMKQCDGKYFPNVKTILRICCTFPITSA